MNTPKAFANFSPRFEAQREPWVTIYISEGTLKGFALRTNPFRVVRLFIIRIPGFSLRFEPWAEISERLRRNSTDALLRIPWLIQDGSEDVHFDCGSGLDFDPGWSSATAGGDTLFKCRCEPRYRWFFKQAAKRQVDTKRFSYPRHESCRH